MPNTTPLTEKQLKQADTIAQMVMKDPRNHMSKDQLKVARAVATDFLSSRGYTDEQVLVLAGILPTPARS